MKTYADLFSGGGGMSLGAIAAGYQPVFGIDNNADAVDCYKKNIGDHIVLGDIRTHDYSGIQADHLHASPSCKTSSMANANRGETDFDYECAEAVCRAIAQIQPETFTLENVEGYLGTDSIIKILQRLKSMGYQILSKVLNAADYGVPQTRKRLIVMASKRSRPSLPIATHSKNPNLLQTDLFGTEPLKKWVSWYEAIADLIPTLKKSKLADWQIKKLECNRSKENLGCFEQSNIQESEGEATRSDYLDQAFLLENTGARSDRPLQYKEETEPSWTIRAMGQDSHWHKANVLERGKVYQINTRCLARLQSFPDSYILPERNSVAGMILGNAVPCLLAQRIMEAF
jgi:DNA (cytosine-5)-methyltransferase 1